MVNNKTGDIFHSKEPLYKAGKWLHKRCFINNCCWASWSGWFSIFDSFQMLFFQFSTQSQRIRYCSHCITLSWKIAKYCTYIFIQNPSKRVKVFDESQCKERIQNCSCFEFKPMLGTLICIWLYILVVVQTCSHS